MSGLAVREERVGDETAVAALLCAAFGGDAEARLVRDLRRDGDLLLALVAEDAGGIVGYIAFSPVVGLGMSAAALAPLAVLPERQRGGIGRTLVERGLAWLAGEGLRLVFVLGDPAYYSRFGFAAGTAWPFRTPYDGPHQQARWLAEPARAGGHATYARAFACLG